VWVSVAGRPGTPGQAHAGRAAVAGLPPAAPRLRLALHVVAALADQRLDVGLRYQVEVARDRMLEAAGGQAEADRALRFPAACEAVQHAGGEGVAAADAVHDRADLLLRCQRGARRAA